MKKIILTAVMFTVLVVAASLSVSAEVFGDWEYTVLDDDTVTLTKYNGSATIVDIPEKIDNKPVTQIWHNAFKDLNKITSVTIPDSVTYIGDYAFYGCRSLTNVTIPDSVTSISYSAFNYCTSLTSVTIPDSVTSISYSAFRYCTSLTSVTIPDSVTYIGDSAFYYCTSLTSVTIPDSVTYIGGYAFYYCTSLTSVTIPDSVTSISHSAFNYCTSLTSVTIPDSVTSIGNVAFSGCSKLSAAYFQHSDASTITTFNQSTFYNTAPNFKIYYPANATGFTTPTWKGYPAYPTDYIAVTSVSLNDNTATLYIGDTLELTATVAPDNATNKAVTWNSDNPNVATVDADGVVTALSIGEANITAKTADGKTAVCAVTVEMSGGDVDAIKIMAQPETAARQFVEIFGAGTTIKNKDGETLSLTDIVGTGSVVTLPNGNELTVVVPGDLTGKGKADIEDAKFYLETLVGNAALTEAQAAALEEIVPQSESDSAIRKLRAFLNFIK